METPWSWDERGARHASGWPPFLLARWLKIVSAVLPGLGTGAGSKLGDRVGQGLRGLLGK